MAIIGNKREQWTVQRLRERIGDYSLFRYYFGEFKPGKCIKSPFRRDKNPSFLIYYNDNGILKFMDLANDSDHGDIGDLVSRKYSLSLSAAIDKMVYDFGLEEKVLKVDCTEYKKEEELIEKERVYSEIAVITKNYTQLAKDYWNSYHIGGDELKRENIYELKEAWIDKRKYSVGNHELLFGYYFPDIDKWKIYRPFAPCKAKKWRNNAPSTYLEGKKGVTYARNLLTTKARKDRIIFRKFLQNVISTQSEGLHCFNEENIAWINSHCEQNWYNADSDEAGVEASYAVTSSLGWKHLNVPYHLAEKGIKDFADWARVEGLKPVEEYLKSKQLI